MVSWWKGSQKMKRTKDRVSIDGYVTTSILTFTPTSEDSGKYLSCRAENPLIAGSAVENGWKLEVHYIPQLSLRLGSKLNHAHIQENNDVYLECNIRASPWVSEIGWRFEGRELLSNISSGIIVSNQSLVLQKVQRHNRGYYTCTGTNTEGQGESNPVYLRVQYSPTCKAGQKTVYGVARHESVRVFCEVEADPPQATFRWDFNNSLETVQVLTFLSDGVQSVATYIPRTETDYGTLLCWARNSVGPQSEPCIYAVIPAGPPDPPENCTLVNSTESSLLLECIEGYDGGLPQYFVMEVHESGQHRVRANITTDVPMLLVQDLPEGSTFVLVVYAANIKGRSQALVLRASTLQAPERQPHKEAMWQFNMSPILLVLIGVVLVLILLGILVVAAMKERSRRSKNNVNEAVPAMYDDLKKQPGLSKECVDKIFSYSVPEEKCPDIIPNLKGTHSSYQHHEQDEEEDQGQSRRKGHVGDVDRDSWKEKSLMFVEETDPTVLSGGDKFSRHHSPDSHENANIHLNSMKTQEVFAEKDGRLLQYQEYPAYSSTMTKPWPQPFRDTLQRSPYREHTENIQTEV